MVKRLGICIDPDWGLNTWTGVGAVDHVVVADMQPVRLIEYVVPPRAQEPSVAIKDYQRMSTAMEHITPDQCGLPRRLRHRPVSSHPAVRPNRGRPHRRIRLPQAWSSPFVSGFVPSRRTLSAMPRISANT